MKFKRKGEMKIAVVYGFRAHSDKKLTADKFYCTKYIYLLYNELNELYMNSVKYADQFPLIMVIVSTF